MDNLAAEQATDWRIDWQAPWLAALRELGQQAHGLVQAGATVASGLQYVKQAHGLLPGWQFVDQQQLPVGQAYEAFICNQRCIPTRNNLHDFFNGLIWLHWPNLKQQLNALQAGEIESQGVGAQRGRLRDSITVLDENGGLLLAPQALCDALREKRWQDLFVHQRELWAQAQFLPIGHALLEKLVQPRKAITAHVICVPMVQAPAMCTVEAADAWLSEQLRSASCNLVNKPYLPIPVLGIPGWCLQNQNFSFYDDSLVFRASRTA
ncbi:DUF3025 domain-containing protein [Comamonas sp. Y33R10-2]|uniref:DUF3025 domain-containing protein n=1 Tax=Comamonas sp. Y33R10-2 TaxID=2853257 RepID=UPI001C5C8508|nr:DUF3025 domain-containing protein [Comamonas sp. Y33R10-2]QXZ11447.1 DUF3025 domain-containing protein [Comamonas sp. Y33R10-2]